VGVLAPASPCPTHELEAGCAVLEKLGLEVVLEVASEDFYPAYLAGSDDYRASRFNRFIADQSIKALFCARGGYGALRILPEISYEQLRLNPKVLVGFSDITALLLACYGQAGLVCFHGPVVSTLGTADPETLESLWKALSSAEPLELNFSEAVCLRPGIAEGSVLGGNFTTLNHLLGTNFFPHLTGSILFIEDRGESMYRIDRMLTQLIHTGHLDNLAGLILGDFSESGSRSDLHDLIQERLAAISLPILSGAPIGHEQRNLTLPLGLTATLDAGTGILTYHEPATAP
jgi:muramoyltetrapeptide carboxypeptidase